MVISVTIILIAVVEIVREAGVRIRSLPLPPVGTLGRAVTVLGLATPNPATLLCSSGTLAPESSTTITVAINIIAVVVTISTTTATTTAIITTATTVTTVTTVTTAATATNDV